MSALATAARPRLLLRSGVCAPLGFSAGTPAAGIRGDGDQIRLDVVVVRSEPPGQAAGVFTRNAFQAAPVVVSQSHIESPAISAVVMNSGNANACTGPDGVGDAEEMCRAVADACGVERQSVLVCSTGIIGRTLPMRQVLAGVRRAALTTNEGGGSAAAEAIMTTDTRPKTATATFDLDGHHYIVGAMAKGSGMIHPDMATLLCLITTDAPVARAELQPMLRRVVDQTFNCVTIDGDTSTNDTVILLANGSAGGDYFTNGCPALAALETAVLAVCERLTEMVAADGEGATRYFRVLVHGASDVAAARHAARTIAGSPLVKAAVHGEDPNWGRVLAAAGRAGVAVGPEPVRVTVGGVCVYDNGLVWVDDGALRHAMLRHGTVIAVHLGAGSCDGMAWGCDLGPGYVRLNAHYTS